LVSTSFWFFVDNINVKITEFYMHVNGNVQRLIYSSKIAKCMYACKSMIGLFSSRLAVSQDSSSKSRSFVFLCNCLHNTLLPPYDLWYWSNYSSYPSM